MTIKNHSTALVLGASGRFGRAAAKTFADAGWIVRSQLRASKPPEEIAGETIVFDIHDTNALETASKGCDVIVNALNPPYPAWEAELPPITAAVISAAKSSGATVLIPGNVYNFGTSMPPILEGSSPRAPDTKKGSLREDMEKTYRETTQNLGIQTIILRMGDFLERRATGNWFDTHMAAKVSKGSFTYPGQTNIPHAWAYLPDAARAMVGLAEKRKQLPHFTDINFGGTTLSGEELRQAIEKVMGRSIRLKTFPWWMLHLMAPFNALISEVLEMRYLWNTPHQLDGTKLAEILPEFRPTPVDEMMRDCLHNHIKNKAKSEMQLANATT